MPRIGTLLKMKEGIALLRVGVVGFLAIFRAFTVVGCAQDC